MRLPTSKKICKKVTCKGGPWHGKVALFPIQDAGTPFSLPFRIVVTAYDGSVDEFYGWYNLNTGEWVSLLSDAELEKRKQELL